MVTINSITSNFLKYSPYADHEQYYKQRLITASQIYPISWPPHSTRPIIRKYFPIKKEREKPKEEVSRRTPRRRTRSLPSFPRVSVKIKASSPEEAEAVAKELLEEFGGEYSTYSFGPALLEEGTYELKMYTRSSGEAEKLVSDIGEYAEKKKEEARKKMQEEMEKAQKEVSERAHKQFLIGLSEKVGGPIPDVAFELGTVPLIGPEYTPLIRVSYDKGAQEEPYEYIYEQYLIGLSEKVGGPIPDVALDLGTVPLVGPKYASVLRAETREARRRAREYARKQALISLSQKLRTPLPDVIFDMDVFQGDKARVESSQQTIPPSDIMTEPDKTLPLITHTTMTNQEFWKRAQSKGILGGIVEDVSSFLNKIWYTGVGQQVAHFLYGEPDVSRYKVVSIQPGVLEAIEELGTPVVSTTKRPQLEEIGGAVVVPTATELGKAFGRGAVQGFFAVVDIPILVAHLTMDPEFRRQVVESVKQLPSQVAVNPFGSFAEFAGSLFGGMVGAHATDIALTKLKGYIRTRGLPEVLPEEIINKEVIEGKKVFAEYPEELLYKEPTVKVDYLNKINQRVREIIESRAGIESSRGYLGLHATNKEFGKITQVQVGTSESPGLYVAPEGSPYFLRLGVPAGEQASTSLRSLFGKPRFLRSPTFIAVQTEKVRLYPKWIKNIFDYNKYVMQQWGSGKNIITFASTQLGKPEMESIISPGTILERISKGVRVEWMGVRVPVRVYKAVSGVTDDLLTATTVSGVSSSLGLTSVPWGSYASLGTLSFLVSHPVEDIEYEKTYVEAFKGINISEILEEPTEYNMVRYGRVYEGPTKTEVKDMIKSSFSEVAPEIPLSTISIIESNKPSITSTIESIKPEIPLSTISIIESVKTSEPFQPEIIKIETREQIGDKFKKKPKKRKPPSSPRSFIPKVWMVPVGVELLGEVPRRRPKKAPKKAKKKIKPKKPKTGKPKKRKVTSVTKKMVARGLFPRNVFSIGLGR